MENKIKNQKEYPGAAEDTYSKATAENVKQATSHLDNNPRSSADKMP